VIFSDQQTQQPAEYDNNGKWIGGGIFNGWGTQSNPVDWRSELPSLSTMEFFDANLDSGIFETDISQQISRVPGGGAATQPVSTYLQMVGRSAVFSAVRNCVTNISIAWGYFQRSVNVLKKLFTGTIKIVSAVMDTLSTVMETIEMAVNAIAWIPIVGWIIKIIYEVAKIITGIISAVKEKKAQRRQDELDRLARQYGLPMAQWSPEADTVMCRFLQMKLMPGVFDLEWAFSPRFPAKNASDFQATRQKYNPDDPCTGAWLVHADVGDDPLANPEGLGFVPGTMNIHGAVSLKVGAGGSVKDYGDFFPITRTVSSQLWSQAVKGDSAMTFAIDTDKLIARWKEYAAAAYGFGVDGIKGWTMIGGELTAGTTVQFDEVNGIRYYCSDCDTGNSNCDEKIAGRKKKSDRKRTPPGDGHRSRYLQHLHLMLGWKTFQHGQSVKQDDWWETMTPVQALRNMRERQDAMIRSPKCMYLDDSTNSGGTGQPRFRSIRKGSEQHKLWAKCVTAMFESGDWKRIDYRDVIPGEEVDKAIRLVLSNRYDTTPEKFFNLDKKFGQGKQSMGIAAHRGPSILGDPEPPAPADPIQVVTSKVKGMNLSPTRAAHVRVMRSPTRATSGTSSRKKSSAAPLLIGAAAVGLLMMRGRKK